MRREWLLKCGRDNSRANGGTPVVAVRRQPRLLHLPKRLHCELPPSRLHHKNVFGNNNNNTEVYSWDRRIRAANSNEHAKRRAVGRLLLNLPRQARGEAATCPVSRVTCLCRNCSVPDPTMGMSLLGCPVRTNYEFADLRFSWYLAARVDKGPVAEHVGGNAACLHLRHDALPALPRPGLAALGTSNAGAGGEV